MYHLHRLYVLGRQQSLLAQALQTVQTPALLFDTAPMHRMVIELLALIGLQHLLAVSLFTVNDIPMF
jgi:hypothetical protein